MKYEKIDIEWNNLECTAPPTSKDGGVVEILKHVSGFIHSGQVTSIMGPSGAGKTTLMDALAGRIGRQNSSLTVKGDILVNGEPVDFFRFRQSVAYVTQEDFLPVTETVRECLMFSAQLRLPRDVSTEDKSKLVDKLIEDLGLTSCANTYIGSRVSGIAGVSGGEKKRASIGVELITSPTCLFLDEPTSGLDSEIAVAIMRTLKGIAAEGKTIALTIHQPNSDITELFDHFILMATGKMLYAAPWESSIEDFAACGFQCPQFKNPTDYYMAVASNPDNTEALASAQLARDAGRRSAEPAKAIAAPPDVEKQAKAPIRQGPQASFLTQMWYLCARNLRMWKRHPIMLIGEAVQYTFIGLFVGGLYFDVSDDAEKGTFDRAASAFFLIISVGLTPAFTAITTWQDERKLVRREVNQSVYGLSTFFWAKTAILLPFEFVFAVVVTIIGYFMFGYQNDFGKFVIAFLVMLLSFLIAESLGLFFSMITATADLAIVSVTLLIIPLLSLTGFLTSDMPVYYEWISHLSFMRYANSAMFANEMIGLELKNPDGTTVRGEDLLKDNSLDTGISVAGSMWILVAMIVVLRVLAFAGLHLSYRRNWI